MSESWRETALAACRLLGDAANGRAFDKDALPDEQSLLGFAKVHRLVTPISGALRTLGVDEEAYRTLHTAAEQAAFVQIKNESQASSVMEELTNRGVRVVSLKGAAIGAAYPAGWIRTATDTDLLVSSDQLDTACDVLTACEFTKGSAHDGDVVFIKPPRTVIELHTTLGGYTSGQQATLERLSCTPFSVNEQYVYALFHLYKHFVYAGAGVRLFFDMYCLSRAVTDRACVARWLDELGLSAFERAVQTVCGVLFDGELCADAMREAVDLVLLCGTFGTSETYHAMKKAAQPIVHKNRVQAWLSDYGFDRTAMITRYPLLKKHGWSYPVCAVHRVVRGMIFKRTVLRHAAEVEQALDPHHLERVLKAMNIL